MKVFLINYGNLIDGYGGALASSVLRKLRIMSKVPGDKFKMSIGGKVLYFTVHSIENGWIRVFLDT